MSKDIFDTHDLSDLPDEYREDVHKQINYEFKHVFSCPAINNVIQLLLKKDPLLMSEIKVGLYRTIGPKLGELYGDYKEDAGSEGYNEKTEKPSYMSDAYIIVNMMLKRGLIRYTIDGKITLIK